eukprot:TRINITY_DN11355_c0_g1_i3.p3 TRINITY_DN11355_c0_g1~~TRINITY_DN11355_c0_g1_i3.p3  ORF type:complete len:109 (+),score=17.29 TRINITY_DN11355_c0_g1_i3:452-778(+)
MRRGMREYLYHGIVICNPRYRSFELTELITKLRAISIFPNTLPKREKDDNELLKGEKAHLIYLMPELVECMVTKEENLREAVRDIIKDVNKMMLGELVELTVLPEDDE